MPVLGACGGPKEASRGRGRGVTLKTSRLCWVNLGAKRDFEKITSAFDEFEGPKAAGNMTLNKNNTCFG